MLSFFQIINLVPHKHKRSIDEDLAKLMDEINRFSKLTVQSKKFEAP